MIITRQLLRDWNACYSDEKIAKLVPLEGVTPLQVLQSDITATDKLWVVLREEILPAKELRLLACKWTRGALALVANPDPRSVNVVDVAEKFANGLATSEELAAAYAAATDAARAAGAGAAAYAAATDAAAYAAARAARAAAYYAARAAAREQQVQDVLKVLGAS